MWWNLHQKHPCKAGKHITLLPTNYKLALAREPPDAPFSTSAHAVTCSTSSSFPLHNNKYLLHLNLLCLFLVSGVYFREPLRRHITMKNIKCMLMLVGAAGIVPGSDATITTNPAVKKVCIVSSLHNSSNLKSNTLPSMEVPNSQFALPAFASMCEREAPSTSPTCVKRDMMKLMTLRGHGPAIAHWRSTQGRGGCNQPRADVAPHVVLSTFVWGGPLRSRSWLFLNLEKCSWACPRFISAEVKRWRGENEVSPF